ncbi:MAG: DUF1937 family protein [Chloroflexi bacterium]|nr:DUF1937 family protein [Chloroflexota bacterium]
MKVYVAGPYTKGDVVVNVRRAVLAAEELIKRGHVPFVPHLTHLWHLISPHPIEFWFTYDNHWLDSCDCLLRLAGDSVGADKEVALAERQGIPVFYDMDELL